MSMKAQQEPDGKNEDFKGLVISVGDSATKNGKTCTNCADFGMECTHDEPVKKRGPKSAYVENLEKRAKLMEELLRKYDVNVDDVVRDTQQSHQASTSSSVPPSYNGVPSAISSNPGYPSLTAESPPSDSPSNVKEEVEEEFAHVALADHLSKLSLNTIQRRFFGPSSAFMIMKNAHKVKEQTLGRGTQPLKRPQYWGMQAWEKDSSDRITQNIAYEYPPNDLMYSLISLYFSEVNIFLPILHYPSFKQCVAQGLHFHDNNFGMMLLTMCAVASRYSNDPRVFADPSSELSSGWRYFEQVQMMRQSIIEVPTLYELQFYSLAAIYMLGTSSPSSAWTLVGVGVRFAEELGIHRRQPEGHKWTSLDEQKRRAFWVLVSLDRLISSFVGRPSAIRDEDFDVEPPLECDDEFWENPDNPELSFKQPPDRPPVVKAFISYLRICEILAFASRTLYSTKKSKSLLGLVGEAWEHKILSEIDTALSNWLSSVPEHLRYDSMQQNNVFFRQSVFLYYNVQIQSHRPFLQKASQASFHSLAVCTNAARSTIHILDAHVSRGIIGLPHILYGAFISAMVIMLNLWGSKRAGIKIDHQKEIEDAKIIMDILHVCDQRWNIAGRFWDMLSELVRDFNLIDHYQPSNKRARNANDPINSQPSQQSHIPSSQSQASTSYQTSYTAPSNYNSQLNPQPSVDSQLASQLMYGWKSSSEVSPAWSYQQAVDSLSIIDKKTLAYLEQIFGKIDNLPQDTTALYENIGQGVYPDSNQGYASYASQLQPRHEGQVLDMAGQHASFWGPTPDEYDFDTWAHYVESMGLSTVTSYQ
ncbi:fungal-specific transcription factor domain-containing protein [Rhodocollybia butyracea]|uniref:Fungal-specific transcription factor domain-containing protein n=1 Tax=Rhodocollybia butyracea TaxID=206335 RepID=A0A9P5UDR1_9AGAR|nr:fungal-specific transcription factor domain-containing protein [Rhodocollybia butyracea]